MRDPRALAEIFAKAEAHLAETLHPDPYIRMWLLSRIWIPWSSHTHIYPDLAAMMPGGTKWCVYSFLELAWFVLTCISFEPRERNLRVHMLYPWTALYWALTDPFSLIYSSHRWEPSLIMRQRRRPDTRNSPTAVKGSQLYQYNLALARCTHPASHTPHLALNQRLGQFAL